MIHLNPEARLNILLPNMNKALGEVISNATPEQLEILKEGKDLKSLLTSIFQDKLSSIKSDTVLLDILKNSTPFKTMGNLSENLRSLIKELKTSPDLSTKTVILEKFLKDITLIDAQTLKNQIANSGVFMESKFATAVQKVPNLIQKFDYLNVVQETKVSLSHLRESMNNDLKSNLLSLQNELSHSNDLNTAKLSEQTDKLLTQIDYHQLTSYLCASNSIYIPFSWDQLEEGSLNFKKTADKKFYCEINLRLKEYGELNLMMALYEGNQLEIQAHTEKPELKTLIQDNIGELRSLLIDADLTPRSIRVFEMRENLSPISKGYSGYQHKSDLDFEVRV